MTSRKISGSSLSRRNFLHAAGAIGAGAALERLPMSIRSSAKKKVRSGIARRAIVLGMDGVDPQLLRRFIAEGHLPTFAKLIGKMHFGNLQTTNPPQSPVAWASFISGCNPGKTGIFDFVHRDPQKFTPYMSTSRSFGPSNSIKLGKWSLPLESGEVKLLRHGPSLWSSLEEHSIPAIVFQIPANFPVLGGESKVVSGMGTPDLLGTYGTYTFLHEGEPPHEKSKSGSRLFRLSVVQHEAKAVIRGPKNTFRSDNADSELEIKIQRDPVHDMVKITCDGQTVILKRGEFSEWVPVRFELVPMFSSIGGMVRFYVQQVHPEIKIYCSPINIDPQDPALPICSPNGFAADLANNVGRYYTQGFPADSKALSNGALSDEEYFEQAKLVIEENHKAFDYLLSNFDDGLFYFYFSSTDQNCHMLWRLMDPTHPLHRPDASPELKNAILYFYNEMDRFLEKALAKVDDNTLLIALSDHGFATFNREFNLNTWLFQNGFLTLKRPKKIDEGEFFSNVDWSKTKAYGIGINGLYINLKGREPFGSVEHKDVSAIKAAIIDGLAYVTDPLTGNPVTTRGYDCHQIYSGSELALAPDIVVGFQRGYRVSDESVLGKFQREAVGNRIDKWAGDHCIDPALVPGILLTNAKCTSDSPAIWDLTPSILKYFGIEVPSSMDGKPVLA